MPNPVVHWEITGKDGKKLQNFYAEAFGWHVDTNNPMDYGMVDTHTERGINGGVAGGDAYGPARVTVYVEVDDLQAYLDRVERLGGKVLMPPEEVPGGPQIALFADPAGNAVGLIKSA